MKLQTVRMLILIFSVALVAAAPAAATDFKTLLTKPDQSFFYLQTNFAGGYDEGEPGDGWGLADRGPRTQATFEWFTKDEKRIQRGYTRFLTPSTWNLKVGLEVDPAEIDGQDPVTHLRLFDAWVQLSTKWDRTSFWLGNRSLPYGNNPRLDPEFEFLPNQASQDLGFGRDLGVFFQTPVSPSWDLRLSATAGGFLAGPIASLRTDGADTGLDSDIEYRGSWLVVANLLTPSFKANNFGLFVAGGKTHRASGPLTEVVRVGANFIHKHRESWKTVHQLAVGQNDGDSRGERDVVDLLNNVELFLGPRWSLGVTNTFRVEDYAGAGVQKLELGTLYASLSYRVTRQIRVRLNTYSEYKDTRGKKQDGVLVQVCTGCGLIK